MRFRIRYNYQRRLAELLYSTPNLVRRKALYPTRTMTKKETIELKLRINARLGKGKVLPIPGPKPGEKIKPRIRVKMGRRPSNVCDGCITADYCLGRHRCLILLRKYLRRVA